MALVVNPSGRDGSKEVSREGGANFACRKRHADHKNKFVGVQLLAALRSRGIELPLSEAADIVGRPTNSSASLRVVGVIWLRQHLASQINRNL